MNAKVPVTVYAESTPNPSALKFVCSKMLLMEGAVDYSHPQDATASPLAQQLFAFSGIKRVFITSNYITVTKDSDIDWYEINGIIREFIKSYLDSGGHVFTSNPFESEKEITSSTSDLKPSINDIPNPSSTNQTRSGSELDQLIIDTLEEYVKPAVEQDGGAIQFKSFDSGVVTVALKGACSGCPSSAVTLKSGIENLLKKLIPDVTSVVAEQE